MSTAIVTKTHNCLVALLEARKPLPFNKTDVPPDTSKVMQLALVEFLRHARLCTAPILNTLITKRIRIKDLLGTVLSCAAQSVLAYQCDEFVATAIQESVHSMTKEIAYGFLGYCIGRVNLYLRHLQSPLDPKAHVQTIDWAALRHILRRLTHTERTEHSRMGDVFNAPGFMCTAETVLRMAQTTAPASPHDLAADVTVFSHIMSDALCAPLSPAGYSLILTLLKMQRDILHKMRVNPVPPPVKTLELLFGSINNLQHLETSLEKPGILTNSAHHVELRFMFIQTFCDCSYTVMQMHPTHKPTRVKCNLHAEENLLPNIAYWEYSHRRKPLALLPTSHLCGNALCVQFRGVSEATMDTKLCSGCRKVRYCCRACQEQAFPAHICKCVCESHRQ